MNMENNSRFPIIPLDYNQRHLAHKKELLFDYKTLRFYVVSADDKSVIYDITQQIVNLINSDISGDSLVVTVEGVGKVNLRQYVSYLKNTILHANSYTGKNAIPSYAYDFSSITNHSGIVQLHNFWNAKEKQVAYKNKQGNLTWDDTDAIHPIVTVNPGLDYIVKISEHYTQTTVTTGCIIKLACKDTREDVHHTYIWKVTSGDLTPNLRFHENTKVTKEYNSDMEMHDNSTHLYTFETWDGGKTWYESCKKFIGGEDVFNDKIDYQYILDNFYTKDQVDDLIKWRNNQGQTINNE